MAESSHDLFVAVMKRLRDLEKRVTELEDYHDKHRADEVRRIADETNRRRGRPPIDLDPDGRPWYDRGRSIRWIAGNREE